MSEERWAEEEFGEAVINTSVDNMRRVLVEAIVIVAVVLFLFLLNIRTTLISLTAIPVSILITFIVFRWMGYSINTMTLGGLAIAIGALVDDAVVDVENIYRRLKQNQKAARPRPVLRVIADASQEIRSGILYSTLIIVLVFVPLFAIPGIEGRLFAPLGIAYIVSILASLLTSITLTPVLCSFLLPQAKRLGEHESFLLRFLKRINGAAISFVLDRTAPVVAGVGLAVAAAIMVVPTLPRAFLPPFNEGALVVTMVLNPGIALSESSRIAQVAERVLLGVPYVKRVARRTGRSEADEHAMGVNVTEFEVILEPTKARTARPDHRRHSRTPRRDSGDVQHHPADQHAAERKRPDRQHVPTSSSRSSATISTRCGRWLVRCRGGSHAWPASPTRRSKRRCRCRSCWSRSIRGGRCSMASSPATCRARWRT